MKPSKIILFSYIGLLFIAATGVVIYGMTTDESPIERRTTENKTITADIKPYKYISTTKQNIDIKADTADYLSITLPKESNVNSIDFKISNDTLYLTRTHKYHYVVIHTTDKKVYDVTSNSAYTSFYNIDADTLTYSGTNNSKINNFYEKTKIRNLNLFLSASKAFAYNGQFKNVQLEATSSDIYFRKSITHISGSANTETEVKLKVVKQINLAMDESSKLVCIP